MRKIYWMLLVLSLGLGACGKKSAPTADGAVPADAENAPVAEQAAAVPATSVIAVPTAPVFAIDEAMPPIDESKGSPELQVRGQVLPKDPEQDVSGNVMIYKMPDQSHLLRIELLNIAGDAPALDVALARSASPQSAADLQGLLTIGSLKGPSGNMNYVIPKGQDVSELHSFVLLRHGEGQLFGSATLSR